MKPGDPAPPVSWLTLALGGWLIHAALLAGLVARVALVGPRYRARYNEYQLLLPHSTEWLLSLTEPEPATGSGVPVLLGILLLANLGMHVWLARWERAWWPWWFWGVVGLLLLLWPAVEGILYLPEIKLRQALSR
jgi:hypothetical protein